MTKRFSELLENISRNSISSDIMEIITQYLLSGKIKPGDKLPTENEFAKKMGVSRNSVREAIKMLSSIGIVKVKQGSGTYITESMSPSMLNPLILSLVFEQGTSFELFQMRYLLDSAAAEFSLQRITSEDIDHLEKKNKELLVEAGKENPDYKKLRDIDLSFHRIIYRLSGNRLLERIGNAIYTLFISSIEKNIKTDPIGAYQIHQYIIEAIKKRDARLVRKILHGSTTSWLKTLELEKPKLTTPGS